jgi:hypothetical protein
MVDMDKAKVSLTIECAPDAAHIPQVVALIELLLNGQGDARELSSALLAALLETSRLIDAGTLSPAEHPRVWDLVETACGVVAEQVQGALSDSAPAAPALIRLNGSNGRQDIFEFDLQEMGQ